MKRALGLLVFLGVIWLLWSGHFEPLMLSFGAVSCVLVVFLAWRMDLLDEEGVPVDLVNWRVTVYIPWLLWEIVKANLDVARRILHPRLPIHPRMIRARASQRSELGQVIYANSITLTPGTVSVDVEDGEITVHALTREAAEGVLTGEMDRRVTALEGRA